jgi:hypothetical protein
VSIMSNTNVTNSDRGSNAGLRGTKLVTNDMITAFNWNFFFLLVQQPPVGQGILLHEVSRSHTTVGRTPLDE